MPCYSDPPPRPWYSDPTDHRTKAVLDYFEINPKNPHEDKKRAAAAKKKLDKITEHLCHVMGQVAQHAPSLYDALHVSVRDWHTEHIKADLLRRQEQQEKLKAELTKKNALDKLTPEERRALGLV